MGRDQNEFHAELAAALYRAQLPGGLGVSVSEAEGALAVADRALLAGELVARGKRIVALEAQVRELVARGKRISELSEAQAHQVEAELKRIEGRDGSSR